MNTIQAYFVCIGRKSTDSRSLLVRAVVLVASALALGRVSAQVAHVPKAELYGVADQRALAVGDTSDCNNNGIPDENDAPIRLFYPLVEFNSGLMYSMTIADVDGDGSFDLVSTAPSGSVLVFLGRGDGTFDSALGSSSGFNYSDTLASGDIDGDGDIDLVVADNSNRRVSALLGNNTGKFAPPAFYPVESRPGFIAIGDLDLDGALDLAVTNRSSESVSVLLGNGDGTFASGVHYKTGDYPFSVAIGDIDSNGNPDLAVANRDSNTVSILLGNGDGTFALAVNDVPIDGPLTLALDDLNGDDQLDLAMVTFDNVNVLLGNGDGTFATAIAYEAGISPRTIAVSDLNRDGSLDIVTVDRIEDSAWVLLGNGDGTFASARQYDAGSSPKDVAVADLNNDGALDVAMMDATERKVSILFQVDADCDNSGVLDECELAAGTTTDCNANDLPDQCELATSLTFDCDGNGALDECELATGETLDCNDNGVPDACEPDEVTAYDCDGDGMLDECGPSDGTLVDCNENSIPDVCDIHIGTDTDCDLNDIPDLCQADCNGNQRPDGCDIMFGISPDENRNQIPDECECTAIYVDDSAHGDNTGDSWENAYQSLRLALNVAQPGQMVWVAEGTYRPDVGPGAPSNNPELSFEIPSGVYVFGGFSGTETCLQDREVVDPADTVLTGALDMTNSHHVVRIRDNLLPSILDGFTITQGRGDVGDSGGGLHIENATVTLQNLRIVENESGRKPFYTGQGLPYTGGGGLFVGQNGHVVIDHCEFISNSTLTGQRGVSEDGHIFFGGSGGPGGAILLHGLSSCEIHDSRFDGNFTASGGFEESPGSAGSGGAIFSYTQELYISDCVFVNNRTGSGGGWGDFGEESDGGDGGAIRANQLTIERCVFRGNNCGTGYYGDNPDPVGGEGGAIHAIQIAASHCIFARNQTGSAVGDNSQNTGVGKGGAISARDGSVSHCTFFDNKVGYGVDVPGGALATDSDLEVDHCIFSEHLAPVFRGDVTARFSLIEDLNAPDEDGNIVGNPQFVDSDANQFRLLSNSDAINTGDPDFVLQAGVTDLDGRPRIQCGRLDIGAYEFGGGVGDHNCDFSVNIADFAEFTSCYSGPRSILSDNSCSVFDADFDLDVDFADLYQFQLEVDSR